MPINVTIAINETVIKTVHIARITGGAGRERERVHEYAVVVQDEVPKEDHEWMTGAFFNHKYGDGVDTLVRKAFEALELDKSPEN